MNERMFRIRKYLCRGCIGVMSTFLLHHANAQQTICASGGDGSGAGGTISFSIGQTVFSTVEGAGGIIIEGVQQPYEITAITGLEDSRYMELIAYPNPATDHLMLKVRTEDVDILSYQLFDMRGTVIQSKVLSSEALSIPVQSLPSAVYFLKIFENRSVNAGQGTSHSEPIKVFKIIKK